MSISAMVLDAKDEFEEKFFIPIAAESFFQECWEPAIEELGLKWTKVFSVGIDLVEEDFPFVIEELSKIKEWAKVNLPEEKKTKIIERIELIESEVPIAFSHRNGIVIFIG
ncbi:hypothetical protein [Paenibacillus azoreducens]|uniref:Uncharacterized protein n=1 Tax=Paenibacillus azoreducens TaxID=116718 RepID=A0A919YBY8_9BACL|nr:hypothetical protein [Paenibacillus azoreducens]GIO46913.1 hypothetical protein J34TS1_16780 [Paenibacillus azoreducens]